LVTCPYYRSEFDSFLAAVDPHVESTVDTFNAKMTCLNTCSPFVLYVYDKKLSTYISIKTLDVKLA
jgi:hypothetical protein